MRRLLAITPPLDTPDLLQHVEALLSQSAPKLMLMLRSPNSSAQEWLTTGRVIRELCRQYQAPAIVGRRVDIALALGADGVHLRARGMDVKEARSLLPEGALVGASAHNEEEIDMRSGASYLTLSPFAASPNKGSPLGASKFKRLAARSLPPIFALGGITSSTAPEAMSAGAFGLAFIRAAFPTTGAHEVRQIGACLEATLDSESR